MKLTETLLAGLYLAQTSPVSDARGAFARIYCEHDLRQALGARHIQQINQTRTHLSGAIRGMHWQYPPHAEMKFVRCIRGRVRDVAVDLRYGSPTFLKWHAEELSSENGLMMIIPEGCAHGFQVLEPDSELLYLHTAYYSPASEGGVRFDDPALGIDWPLAVTELSERDSSHRLISPDFEGIRL
jgi:dTDP-4-dehydrorhamnose 3,5-epimerase